MYKNPRLDLIHTTIIKPHIVSGSENNSDETEWNDAVYLTQKWVICNLTHKKNDRNEVMSMKLGGVNDRKSPFSFDVKGRE